MRRARIVCDNPAHPRPILLAAFKLEIDPDDGRWFPVTTTGRGLRIETAADTGLPVSPDQRDARFRALQAGLPDPDPEMGATYLRVVITCPACRRQFSARAFETMGPLWERLAEDARNVLPLSDLSRMVQT